MRGKKEMYGLVALLVFVFTIIGIHELSAQQEAIAVEWGDALDCPDLGFNARILRPNNEEDCGQPIQEDFRYDWNSANLRQDVRNLDPKILRFPGGTPANYWNWYSETRQVIGDNGQLRDLEICEASLIGRFNSMAIGCSGDMLDMTAETFEDIELKTTVTLKSYLEAIDHFRNQDVDVQELYVLTMLDPFYYLGSPHLEYITAGASPDVVKDTLKNNIVNRVIKQLDKLLFEKCADCETNDDHVEFELGNEFHLQRYGKYYPRPECFDMIDDSLCFNCHPDVEFYAEVCEEIIPEIRSRFSNSEISVNASRDILHLPWNQVLLDRFNQGDELQVEAAVFHFYPKTFNIDSLSLSRCIGAGSGYSVDNSLHYIQAHLDRMTFQKNLAAFENTGLEIWITEFNSYDYSEKCDAAFNAWDDEDFVYDSADWLHFLNLFTIMDRFLTYRTDMDDPWTNNSMGLDIEKLAMHLFYGADREAALNENRDMTAAGMAMSTIIELMNGANSLQRLLIAPEEHIQLDGQGNWSTDIADGEMLPLFHHLEYSDHTGAPAEMNTMDSHGWIYQNGSTDKAVISNLRGEAINLNLNGMKSFTRDIRYTIHYVAYEDLATRIENGWNTSFVNTLEGETSAASLTIPAYSIVVLEDIPELLPAGLAENETHAFSVFPNPTNGELNIRLENERGLATVVTVSDVSGRDILRTSFTGQSTRLELGSLSRGTYLVRVANDSFDETVRVQLTR